MDGLVDLLPLICLCPVLLRVVIVLLLPHILLPFLARVGLVRPLPRLIPLAPALVILYLIVLFTDVVVGLFCYFVTLYVDSRLVIPVGWFPLFPYALPRCRLVVCQFVRLPLYVIHTFVGCYLRLQLFYVVTVG